MLLRHKIWGRYT